MLERLLKLFISFVFYIVYKNIVVISSLFRKRLPGTIVILTYHAVKPQQQSQLERQLDELLKLGHPVRTDITYPLSEGHHYIAVTFDDGFQSVLNYALPLMSKRRIPATIFVPTGYLGEKPGWIFNPQHENANESLLTKEQLQQLPDDLITIGSHCVTHPHLAKIDIERAFSELKESKKTLEEIVGKRIDLLSLPYGSYNKNIIQLAKEAGFRRAFLNIPTPSFLKGGNYLVGRIDVSLDDWLIEFRLKLLGAYQWVPFAIIIKRGLIKFTKTIVDKDGREQS